MAASRFLNVKYNSNSIYRLEIIRIFASYYETVHPTIEKWVFSCIRTPYLSIYNNDDLNLNLSNLFDTGKTKERTYIAIETRIKGFFEGLTANTTEDLMELNIRKLLSIVTNQGSFVPLRFFYRFVLCRIKTENSELL